MLEDIVIDALDVDNDETEGLAVAATVSVTETVTDDETVATELDVPDGAEDPDTVPVTKTLTVGEPTGDSDA
jgi:hypothetical protein